MSITDSGLRTADHEPNVFVSIIIPARNSGERLIRTLHCCSAIHGISYEIIVVDDGSTDGTPEIIKAKFPSVRLYRLSSASGTGSAGRNLGLSLARGIYVKFLDHDDLIQPRGLRNECEQARKSGADIVMSRWGVVHVDGRGRFDLSTMKLLTPPHPCRLKGAILRGETVPFTSAALYRKDFVARECWDPAIKMIDDFDWFCRMALKAAKLVKTDSLAYFWLQHPDSLQATSRKQGMIYRQIMQDRYLVFTKLEGLLRQRHRLTSADKVLLSYRYYSLLRWSARYQPDLTGNLLNRLVDLNPQFEVDACLEPDPLQRWLIRRLGLAAYLRVYRLFSGLRSR